MIEALKLQLNIGISHAAFVRPLFQCKNCSIICIAEKSQQNCKDQESMATKLIQPHLLHPVASSTNKIIRHFTATHSVTKRSHFPLLWTQTVASAKAVDSGVDDSQTIHQIKASLYDALQGINRGIFGVPSEKKAEIEGMVKLLESRNPTPEPTANLDKMAGNWRLVYSTITILGSKRTKLGLRDFINLGDFYQDIDVIEGKAVNVVEFSARGLNLFKGQLRIEATYKIASNSRVDILYQSSTISPEQLMNLFQKNYNLLLGIFNPEGWLNITYVDDDFRIGRDDKGNIFVLERLER